MVATSLAIRSVARTGDTLLSLSYWLAVTTALSFRMLKEFAGVLCRIVTIISTLSFWRVHLCLAKKCRNLKRATIALTNSVL